MSTGAALLIVLSMVLFMGVAIFSWWTGLLDDANFDSMALSILALLFLLFWALPSLTALAAWWHYR